MANEYLDKLTLDSTVYDLRDSDAQSKVSEIAQKVGTLTDLETTAKNNLVSAINEVANMIVTSLNTPV